MNDLEQLLPQLSTVMGHFIRTSIRSPDTVIPNAERSAEASESSVVVSLQIKSSMDISLRSHFPQSSHLLLYYSAAMLPKTPMWLMGQAVTRAFHDTQRLPDSYSRKSA